MEEIGRHQYAIENQGNWWSMKLVEYENWWKEEYAILELLKRQGIKYMLYARIKKITGDKKA